MFMKPLIEAVRQSITAFNHERSCDHVHDKLYVGHLHFSSDCSAALVPRPRDVCLHLVTSASSDLFWF